MLKTRCKIRVKEAVLSMSDYFLALMLILNCHSLYERSMDINFHIYEATLFAILLNCALKVSLNAGRLKILPKTALIFVVYAYVIFLLLLIRVSMEDWFSFSARFLAAPLILLFSNFGKTERERHGIYVAFVRLTAMITVVSVVLWLFGSFLHILSPTGIFRFQWSAVEGRASIAYSYYNVYFETQYADLLRETSSFGWRNSAIFTEGPMFGLVLDIALLFYYVFKDRWNLPKGIMYILLLGIVTSFSTTSYLFTAVIIYLQVMRRNKYALFLYMVFVPVMLIGVTYLLLNKSGTGSFSFRMDDYRAGVIAWLQSPIIGHGYNSWDAINENKLIARNGGYSNAIFALLAQGGILFFGLYAYPIMRGFCKRKGYFRVISLMYLMLLASTIFQTAFINFYLWALLLESVPLAARPFPRTRRKRTELLKL